MSEFLKEDEVLELVVEDEEKSVELKYSMKFNSKTNMIEMINEENKELIETIKPEELMKVLSKYAIPYIDLSEVSGMNTRYADVANAYTHNGDYVHPNQLGYETYYTPKISAWMNMM